MMNMKRTQQILILVLLLSSSAAFAQHVRFPMNGVIEFERSVNMYAMYKKAIGTETDGFLAKAFDSYKKTNPQFKKLKSTLAFSKDKTLFTPVEAADNTGGFLNDPMAKQLNTILTDLETRTSITQKDVYEDKFLVKDSIRNINWKITDENREIAGYPCRRANAIIMDSIYVVAFYTDQIPVSGGPESFNGLPGMILGVALPHENVSWFATSVTDRGVLPKELASPTKGKATDNKGLKEILMKALKDWGDYAQSSLKAFSM
jgi:GLPGLI family protein